jgi:hypothetical protein
MDTGSFFRGWDGMDTIPACREEDKKYPEFATAKVCSKKGKGNNTKRFDLRFWLIIKT